MIVVLLCKFNDCDILFVYLFGLLSVCGWINVKYTNDIRGSFYYLRLGRSCRCLTYVCSKRAVIAEGYNGFASHKALISATGYNER